MAELTQGERLQPSLLDRLLDEYPEKRRTTQPGSTQNTEESPPGADAEPLPQNTRPGRTPRSREANHLINSRQLREYVKRDLAWLLNCGNLENAVDLSTFPNVAKSVLNYGMPDLTGLVASTVDTHAIERALVNAIRCFEPRVLKRSLRVSVSTSDEMSRNALKFEIECDVWGQPAPERMYLHSEIDLEDGVFKFQESGG